jgi:hypothetical protein
MWEDNAVEMLSEFKGGEAKDEVRNYALYSFLLCILNRILQN